MNRSTSKSNSATSRSKSAIKTSDTISQEKIIPKTNAPIKWSYQQKNVTQHKIVLSQAHGNGFRFVGFDEWSDALDLIKNGECIYEDYNKTCKPYIDYEYKCDYESYIKNKSQYDKIALDRMRSIVDYVKMAMFELTTDGDMFDVKVTQSHGMIVNTKDNFDRRCYKYSYHFVVNSKYRFENTCDAKRLVDIIVSKYDNDVTKFIDRNVYKTSYQKMRCIFSYKNKDDKRILEPNDHDGNVLTIDDINVTDYLISHYDDDIVLLKIDDNNGTKKESKKVPKNNTVTPKQDDISKIDSDESRDLLCMLKKYIKSAHFVSNDRNNTSEKTFYAFDYNHNEKCICNNTHDRINGYVYVSDMNVYAGCYSEKCKKKTKKIGTLNVTENWNLPNVEHIDSCYMPDDENIMDKLREFISDDTKIMAMRANMGMGKTRSVKLLVNDYFIKYDINKRVLAFSLRRSYTKDVVNNAYEELKFTNYLDVRDSKKLNDHNRLIISLESLNKLFLHDVKAYDIIILDECESLLTHFFSSTVKIKRECYENFITLLQISKKIICLDADLTINRSIKFLESITNKIKIYKNDYRTAPRKYICMNNFERYYDKIKLDIENDKNIAIVTISEAHGQYLRDQLRKDYPNISDKIQFIFGHCDKVLKDQLINVNLNWSDLRVLIYNTVIGQGVDYNIKNYFHKVYLYNVIGDVCSARVLRQMLGRIRYPENKEILVFVNKMVNKKTDAFVYSLDYAKKYCHLLLSDVETDKVRVQYRDDDGNTCIHTDNTDTVWNNLMASHLQEKINSGNKNIMTTFKMLIEANGDIYEEDYDDNINYETFKTHIDRLTESNMYTDKEFNDKQKKEIYTEKENLIMMKTQIRHEFNFIDTIPNEIMNEAIRIFLKERDIARNIMNLYNDGGSEDDDVEQLKRKHLMNVCKEILSKLEFKNDDRQKTYTTIFFNNCIEFLEINDATILALNTRGKMKDKYYILKTVLARYGIIVSKFAKDKYINGNRTTESFVKLCRNKVIYEIIYCLTHNNTDDYDATFMDMIKYYDKYQKYIYN